MSQTTRLDIQTHNSKEALKMMCWVESEEGLWTNKMLTGTYTLEEASTTQKNIINKLSPYISSRVEFDSIPFTQIVSTENNRHGKDHS